MSDAWDTGLHDAAFGGMALNVLTTSDDFSHPLVVSEYYGVDGAKVVDVGRGPRSTDVEIIFITDSIRSMKAFLDLCDGTPRQFIHPLTGSYVALPRNIHAAAGARNRDEVRLAVTFVEHSLDIAPIAVAGDPSGDAESARAIVQAEAVEMDVVLESDPDKGTIIEDSASLFDWLESANATQRAVNLRVGALVNRIEDEITRLELLSDVRNYPLFISLRRLQASARRLGEHVVSTAEQITTFVVTSPTSLAAIMTELYGARAVTERHAQTQELNDIANPARIEAGTVLRVYQP